MQQIFATLFSFVAVAPIVRTYQALADGLPILALHHALSGTATLIMAALLVLRREALFRTTRRREQVAAIVETFMVLPLGLVPLKWQSDWLLELISVGFIVAHGWIIWSLLTLRRSFSNFPRLEG